MIQALYLPPLFDPGCIFYLGFLHVGWVLIEDFVEDFVPQEVRSGASISYEVSTRNRDD